jgi:hypothetical protein
MFDFSTISDLTHHFQKDGKRPGEAGYDPRTLHIPAKAWKTFTPFEKQVKSCALLYEKNAHTTAVLGDQAEPL